MLDVPDLDVRDRSTWLKRGDDGGNKAAWLLLAGSERAQPAALQWCINGLWPAVFWSSAVQGVALSKFLEMHRLRNGQNARPCPDSQDSRPLFPAPPTDRRRFGRRRVRHPPRRRHCAGGASWGGTKAGSLMGRWANPTTLGPPTREKTARSHSTSCSTSRRPCSSIVATSATRKRAHLSLRNAAANTPAGTAGRENRLHPPRSQDLALRVE